MSKFILITAILSFSLSACTTANTDVKNPTSSIQKTLNTHLKQWNKLGIKRYSYELQRSCYCPQEYLKPVIIHVKDNVLSDARFKDNHKQLPKELKGNRKTIPMLFETIQKAIDKKAHSIKVEYNEQYGYPTSITVDFNKQIVDEELYFSAKDLKLL